MDPADNWHEHSLDTSEGEVWLKLIQGQYYNKELMEVFEVANLVRVEWLVGGCSL